MSRRGPGKPRLREGEETVRVAIRMAASDRDLLRRAAAVEDDTLSEIVRHAALVEACSLLGLDPDAYLVDGEERPTEPATCATCGRGRGER